MANYWGTDITLSTDNKKMNLETVAQELQQYLDPSENHTILGDLCILQNKMGLS